MRCCYLSDPFTCTHSYIVEVRVLAFNLCLHLYDLERLCKSASPPGPSLLAHVLAQVNFVYSETYVASCHSLFCTHTCRGINFASFWTYRNAKVGESTH